MRILHVIPSVSLADGGPSIAIRAMAEGLAQRGLEVEVASTVTADDPAPELAALGGRPGEPRYRLFPRSLPGSWKLSLPLTRWIHDEVRRFDVVHVHALFSYATIPGCRLAYRAGVPYVLRPLGTLDSWSLGQRRWKKQPYYRLLERQHLARAAAVHATSEAEAAAVAALGFGDRTRVIPLGVRVPASGERQPARADAPVRLLFLSRLHPKKGLPMLLEAVAALRARGAPPVELVVAGDGDARYRAELEQRTSALGLERVVRFVGHVGGERKAELLRQADVFVLPSYQENFGIAVAEAMAAGLPVVVSDAVALSAEVRQAEAGLVVPCQTAPLVDALAALLADPGRRAAMGRRAGELARTRFSWERCCQSLEDLYRELAGARAGGGT